MDTAAEILATIDEDQKNKIARFLEGQGYKEMALEVATDAEHRFDLALGLGNLGIALDIAREADVEHRWKTVGDAALAAWDLKLAEECFSRARDLGSLLLMHTACNNADGLRALATQATDAGAHNVAFNCLWHVGDVDGCLDILLATGRIAEAVLFAQTYRPSRCRGIVVGEWKVGLEKAGKGKVSRMLGVPPGRGEEGNEGGDEELFPEWEEWLSLEEKGGSGSEGGLLVDVDEGEGEDSGVDGVDGANGAEEVEAAA